MKVVKVTQKDIKEGLPENARLCPVARAISRVVKSDVEVDGAFWMLSGGIKVRKLPKKVTEFIDKFDTRRPVKPFTFCIKEPVSA